DALPAPQPIPTLSIRRDAPHCENVYVYIVTDLVAGGAVATMAIGEKSRGRQRRVGHRLGDYEVIAIGSLGFGRGPAVWLSQREHVCVAPMSADNPVRQRQLKARLAKERAKAKREAKAERKSKAKSKAKKRARQRAKRRAR